MNSKSTWGLTAIIFLFSIFASAQSNFNFSKDHDALLVRDLAASANFYGEILGLKEISNGGLGEHIRWFELNDKVQIHLIQSDEPVVKVKGVHMAINTKNLSDFRKYLTEKGVDYENWPGEKKSTNMRPDGVNQIYLQDPDGYWIEINDGKL